MLLERHDEPVNPSPRCEQPGDGRWKAPTHPTPRLLQIKWAGGKASVMDWPGWDTAAAYLHAEHMAGFREGDVVVVYALNWQMPWAGRA